MNIIWPGLGSFRFEIEDQVVPFERLLNGNPKMPEDGRKAAIAGATPILVSLPTLPRPA